MIIFKFFALGEYEKKEKWVNKITNKESNAHKVESINKHKRKDNNGKDWVEWIIDAVEDLFRI